MNLSIHLRRELLAKGPPISTLTYSYRRVKDRVSGKHLQTMAFAVQPVWNDCSEVYMQAWPRHRGWPRGFDLITLMAGSSKLLGLHSDTLAEGCRNYATRGAPFRTWRLNGSLTQDARGHGYLNVCCEGSSVAVAYHNDAEIGVDLGLKDQVICSDGMTYSRAHLTRHYAARLGMAQRARKKRKDWAHKVTTDLVRSAKTVRVGHVSSSRLGKTRLAKSVYDAGWPQLRAVADRQSQ